MLSHLKSAFSLLQCIDVRKNSVRLDEISLVVAQREIAIQEPEIGSICAAAAQLLLDGLPCGQSRPPIGDHSVNIFGVYGTRPAPAQSLFPGETEVVQPTLAEKITRSVRQS